MMRGRSIRRTVTSKSFSVLVFQFEVATYIEIVFPVPSSTTIPFTLARGKRDS